MTTKVVPSGERVKRIWLNICSGDKMVNPWSSELFLLKSQSLEVVSRHRDSQQQVNRWIRGICKIKSYLILASDYHKNYY